jgi:hypothetical protein
MRRLIFVATIAALATSGVKRPVKPRPSGRPGGHQWQRINHKKWNGY